MKREGYVKVREFTAEVAAEMDACVYPKVFDSIRRIDDKTRYKNNDSVAAVVDIHGHTAKLMEKYIHRKEGQCFYFEAYHTNARGSIVSGIGLKSQADIIAYVVWDDNTKDVAAVHFLSVKWLKQRAAKHYALHIAGQPSHIKRCIGEVLRNGSQYKVWSFEFDINKLPEEAFVHVDGQRVDIINSIEGE